MGTTTLQATQMRVLRLLLCITIPDHQRNACIKKLSAKFKSTEGLTATNTQNEDRIQKRAVEYKTLGWRKVKWT